jgi:hypothetical protein
MPAASRVHEWTPSAPTISGRTGRDDVESRHAARRLDQRGIECAVLDDPRQRALAHLIGGELDPSAGVAAHVHRFDRCDTLDRKQLPRADAVQEAGAARTDRVNPLVPAVAVGFARRRRRRGDAAAIGDHDAQAGTRQRRGKRKTDQAGADDNHVARAGVRAHPSTSIT